MGLAPLAPTAAPTASPPRVGLLASVRAVEETERWESGFGWSPEGCGSAGVLNPCGGDTKVIADNPDQIQVEPFTVWAGDKCSPFDRGRDLVGRARRQLAAAESYVIASELWTGSLASSETTTDGDPWPNRYLASEQSDVLTDGATSMTDALACLEYGLGRCSSGARGMIHATRQAVTHWMGLGLVRRDGNLILTVHDTIVVPDAGYDGSSPVGAPATEGHQWAYGTGLVFVRLGPVTVLPGSINEAMDRAVNLVEYRAERMAAVTFDGCCHLAVELDLSLCDIGGLGS